MTTLNFSQFNQMVNTVVNAKPETFNHLDISYQDVVLSLPFKLVGEEDEDYFIRRKYVLDTGAHCIEYVYSYDGYDDEDSHDFYIDKSLSPKFGTEKLIGCSGSYTHSAILRVIEDLQLYINVVKQENTMTTLNLEKTSFTKKEIRANLEALKVCESEIILTLDAVKKTMLGKSEAMKIMLHACVTVHADDTGLVYTPDQLIVDLEKKLGKTYTSEAMDFVLKEIWTAVALTLNQYPKGHKLIKDIIVGLHKEFKGKSVVGIAQVRTAAYELALKGYAVL